MRSGRTLPQPILQRFVSPTLAVSWAKFRAPSPPPGHPPLRGRQAARGVPRVPRRGAPLRAGQGAHANLVHKITSFVEWLRGGAKVPSEGMCQVGKGYRYFCCRNGALLCHWVMVRGGPKMNPEWLMSRISLSGTNCKNQRPLPLPSPKESGQMCWPAFHACTTKPSPPFVCYVRHESKSIAMHGKVSPLDPR